MTGTSSGAPHSRSTRAAGDPPRSGAPALGERLVHLAARAFAWTLRHGTADDRALDAALRATCREAHGGGAALEPADLVLGALDVWAAGRGRRDPHEQHAASALLAARRNDRPYIVRLRAGVKADDPLARAYFRYADIVIDHTGALLSGGEAGERRRRVHSGALEAAEVVPASHPLVTKVLP